MWKRKELKEKAKKVIKKNYWTIIIVCFIMSILTSEYGLSSANIERNFESADITSEIQEELLKNNIPETLQSENEQQIENVPNYDFEESINSSINSAVKEQKYIYKIVDGIVKLYGHAETEAIVLFITAVISFLFVVFVADPLIVGEKRFFIKTRKNSKTKIGVLVSIFKKDQWANIAKTMLIKNIFMFMWILVILLGIFLGATSTWVQYLNLTDYTEGIVTATGTITGLVIILLGIVMYLIKNYEYRMVPYLLAENPHLREKEIFKLTKQMMHGNKWKAFVLDLSFMLWYILSMFTLGLVAIFYVNPYTEATKTELYAKLRNEAVKKKYKYYERLVEAKQQEKVVEVKKEA